MPTQRTARLPGLRLSEVEQAVSEGGRFVDHCLAVRHRDTREILLEVGGRWDRVERRYVGDAATQHVVDVNESQASMVREFRRWLEARLSGRDRKIVIFAGGKRRGGKTVAWTLCLMACCIAMRDAVTWAISPQLGKRDEIERWVKRLIPRRLGWWTYRGTPEFKFHWLTGSILQNLSGEIPDSAKRGGVECYLINEAQDMDRRVYSLSLPAIQDTGGLCLVAANPPQTPRGEWVLDVKRSIDEGRTDGVYIDVDPAKNADINQATRGKVAQAVADADPKAAEADLDGAWRPVGDRSYSHFDKKRNLGEPPDLGDVTDEVIRRKLHRPFGLLGGVDFQSRPFNVGVIVKAFGDAVKPIYYAVGEVMREGFEDEFLDDVYIAGYEPEQLLWIGDASGTWQDAHHGRGRVSFDIFKARRWRIEPPTKKKSDRGEHPKNPDVLDRVNRVNQLLGTGRLIVSPTLCPKLATALEKCDARWGKPSGYHAHITDALGYALWWAEPDPKAAPRPLAAGARSITVNRQGSDW